MLKWLRLLAIPALIAAVILVTRHYKDYDTGPKGYDARCIQENHSSPAAGYLVCSIETSKNAETGKPHPQWWYKLVSWPEGITAWLVLFTLYFVACQSWDTRKAASATEIAANAALKQADHMVASERAWLTAQVLDFAEPAQGSDLIWISVPITNRGKTPARIDSIVVTSRLIPVPETSYGMPGLLPETPDYAVPKAIAAEGRDIIIGPDETFHDMPVYIHPREWEQVKAKKLSLYVYGFVDYFDTLEGLRHRTAFCSIYWRTDPKYNEPRGFVFSSMIPAAYFRAT